MLVLLVFFLQKISIISIFSGGRDILEIPLHFLLELTFLTAHIIIAVLLGIILKMACLTKDGSSQGQSSGAEFVSKAPSKTLIIPGKELVQVIAKVCCLHLFAA